MLKKKTIHIVIMAGGSGKRLWPLSRSGKPKQFIKLKGEKTLLEETIERVKNIFENQKIYVVTTKNFASFVNRLVGNYIYKIIIEPEAKNTAPAVLFSCLNLQANPEDVVIFLPSDHHIPDFVKFRESIINTIQAASETNNIVLVGIKPSYPSTGYGYISMLPDKINNLNGNKNNKYFNVNKFHEKPDLILAKKYFNDNNMLWNSGIICAKNSVLLESFEKEFPEIKKLLPTQPLRRRQGYGAQVDTLSLPGEALAKPGGERSIDFKEEYSHNSEPARGECSYEQSEEECIEPCGSKYLSKIYNIIPEISFDHAILEKINNLNVIIGDFYWSDIGTLDTFIAAKKDIKDQANLISIESENNLIETQNKLIVLVGVKDLCIIETEDVLLVAAKKDLDKIKDIVQELNNSEKDKYC